MFWSYDNIFVHKENKNNGFIQQFLLLCVLICVQKMNEGLTGLERHEGE